MSVSPSMIDYTDTKIVQSDSNVGVHIYKRIDNSEMYLCQNFSVKDPSQTSGAFFMASDHIAELIDAAEPGDLFYSQ